MPEADPENRLHRLAGGVQDPANVAHGLHGHLGVAGSVAEEEAVILRLVQRVVPRDDVDAGPALDEAPQLVHLEAAVDGADPGEAAGVHRVGFLCASRVQS